MSEEDLQALLAPSSRASARKSDPQMRGDHTLRRGEDGLWVGRLRGGPHSGEEIRLFELPEVLWIWNERDMDWNERLLAQDAATERPALEAVLYYLRENKQGERRYDYEQVDPPE